MIRLFTYLILFTGIGQGTPAYGRDVVSVEGVRAADLKSLRAELKNPSLSDLDEILRKLMKTGDYETVRLIQKPSGLALIAVPIRKLTKLTIQGVSEFSERELINAASLKVGERFDRDRLVKAAEKLKSFYGERGYFNAAVEINFLNLPENQIEAVIKIAENAPCRIAAIDINTNNPELLAKLRRRVNSLVGSPLSSEVADRIHSKIADYFSENRYLRAKLTGPTLDYNSDRSAVRISYVIADPYRYEVFFEGYVSASRTDIYRALDLENYRRDDLDPVTELTERLKKFYLPKGFPFVKISARTIEVADGFLRRLYLDISEGPKTKVTAIDVAGRISREPSYYSQFIKDHSTDLVSDGFYYKEDYELGVKNLVTELRNLGFLRARLQSLRTEFSEKRDQAVVKVVLDEGPLTTLKQLKFEGVEAFPVAELETVVGLKSQSPLRLNQLENGIAALKKYYLDRGYLEMRITNESDDLVIYNEKGSAADIVFKIHEGPKITVAQIVVEGNTFTKDYVVLQEISIHVGDLLTPDAIDESLTRLNKLGIFARIDIKTLEEGSSVAARTLVISVTERDPGTLRFGPGVNNERALTLRGFIGASYNNIDGTARGISVRADLKYNIAQVRYLENKIAGGYFEPYLFGSRTRGRVNLSRSEYVFSYEADANTTVINRSNKLDFLLERDLSRHTKLTWTALSFDSRSSFERDGKCVFDPTSGTCIDAGSSQQIVTFGPTLDFDYRDNPFLPTKGVYARFDLEYSDPIVGSSSGIKFFRTEGLFSHYTRLGSPRWVWANSFRSGYEANLSTDAGSGIPTSHAFFLGGFNTIRGFDGISDVERILPQYELPVSTGNQKIVPFDSYYYLVKSELRFPLINNFGGVLFYDGGLVQVTGVNSELPWRSSVGVGGRYNTVVGPVSIDLARKLEVRRDKGEVEYRIHFYIGTF